MNQPVSCSPCLCTMTSELCARRKTRTHFLQPQPRPSGSLAQHYCGRLLSRYLHSESCKWWLCWWWWWCLTVNYLSVVWSPVYLKVCSGSQRWRSHSRGSELWSLEQEKVTMTASVAVYLGRQVKRKQMVNSFGSRSFIICMVNYRACGGGTKSSLSVHLILPATHL